VTLPLNCSYRWFIRQFFWNFLLHVSKIKIKIPRFPIIVVDIAAHSKVETNNGPAEEHSTSAHPHDPTSPHACCPKAQKNLGPVWYSFMSSFTSSFTTSIAKQPTLCPTLWSASLKTHSHRVKHMVKLQKHGSLPRSWSCSWSCFLKNSSTGEAELCQTGP
jgi:hypothetical protein